MRWVRVNSKLDLRGYLGAQFMRAAENIEIVNHPHEGPATDIRLAVAWHPPDDAFVHYPNLQAVCSIGAGVDNMLACPSLPPEVDVIRVVDPAQAQMMSGFVAWHVIGHQRRFATYQAQQREERWQRLGLRRAQDVPVGILGFGEIGRRVAVDLALLGFPVMAWNRAGRCFGQPGKRYAPAGAHRTPSTANAATERQQWILSCRTRRSRLLPLTRSTPSAPHPPSRKRWPKNWRPSITA